SRAADRANTTRGRVEDTHARAACEGGIERYKVEMRRAHAQARGRETWVMTSMMKAAVKLKPAPKSTEVRNVPIPEPTPSEVLIRMDIASICGTDVHIYDWDAWAAARIKVPLVQGHEFAGHIEKLGSGVTGIRKGDYVSAEGHIACGRCYMCRTGNAHVCKNVSILGIDRAGSFAQYMTVPASNVIVNDDDLPRSEEHTSELQSRVELVCRLLLEK